MVVIKIGSFYGQPFRTDRGVTQGDPVSPTAFNILMYKLLRVVPMEVCGPQEVRHRLSWSSG